MIDLTGEKFGRLRVLKLSGKDKHGHKKWLCLCECGNESFVLGDNLKKGNTSSCGCLAAELRVRNKTIHGHRGALQTGEYTAWINMKMRCTNLKDDAYHRYGGRGISICKQWLNSFETFISDMGNKPTKNHTIDRIDNDGNYEPSNCRWATRSEQMNNYSRNRLIVLFGVTYTVKQASKVFELKYTFLRDRIYRGWEPHDAVFTPQFKR